MYHKTKQGRRQAIIVFLFSNIEQYLKKILKISHFITSLTVQTLLHARQINLHDHSGCLMIIITHYYFFFVQILYCAINKTMKPAPPNLSRECGVNAL